MSASCRGRSIFGRWRGLRSSTAGTPGRLNFSVAERIGEAAEMKRPPQPCSTPAHAPAPAPCDVSRETDAGGSRGPSGRARPQGAGGGDDPDRRHRTGGLDPFTQTIRAPGPRGWLGSPSATAPSRPRGHGTERTTTTGLDTRSRASAREVERIPIASTGRATSTRSLDPSAPPSPGGSISDRAVTPARPRDAARTCGTTRPAGVSRETPPESPIRRPGRSRVREERDRSAFD
jgi:hypothetical protein